MENFVFDGDENSKKILEQEGLESSEEGFMKGYSDDETVEECAECGSAVDEEKKVAKEVDGETFVFCSEICAEDFEDSMN